MAEHIQYIVIPDDEGQPSAWTDSLTYEGAAHRIGVPIEPTPVLVGSVLLCSSPLIDPAGYRAKPHNLVASALAGREVRGTAILTGPRKYDPDSGLAPGAWDDVQRVWETLIGEPPDYPEGETNGN